MAIQKSLETYLMIHVQNTGGLCCSGTNGLLTSDFSSSTRGERHNSYCANPAQRAVHLVMFKISVGRDPKIPTTCANGQNSTLCLNGRNSNLCLHGLMSTFNWLFFKNLKFSGPCLPSMMSSTLQPHFLSGVYSDNGDCHILCTRA